VKYVVHESSARLLAAREHREGIAARLNDRGQAELFADGKWQLAPHPILENPLKL
jgi:hypothetical protein